MRRTAALLFLLALMPFLTGYTLRKAITIDNTFVDSDLTDFPLLVKVTADAAIGAAIDAGGQNVRFTAADGTTPLKYERQSFSVSGGAATGVFWVKVPTVAGAADTTIYIYYKGGVTTDGEDATNAWDANFLQITHFEQDPSGSSPQVLDSTANNYDGTSAGSMTSGDLVSGKVGYGLDFDGADDAVTTTLSGTTIGSAWTLEAVVKPTSNSYPAWVAMGIGDHKLFYGFGANIYLQRDAGGFETQYGVGNLSLDTWHHLAVSHAGTSAGDTKIYVNGTDVTGTASAIPNLTGGGVVSFGKFGGFTLAGITDEGRVSNTVRSAAWLKFTHRNIFEADNEIAFGAEESAGGGETVTMDKWFAREVRPASRNVVVAY